MSYQLSCCSTADLTAEHFKSRDISLIYFHFFLDGVEYADDLGQSIPFEEFYRRMASGSDTATSQINPAEFVAYFEPMLKAGKDILHVTLSSGISGVYSSACIAAEELSEKYPDRKILIVDSLAASGGYGLFMDKLADLRDQGLSITELYDWALANRLKLHHWFFSTDLTFFIKGGRVSPAAGFVGGLLNICPLLNVDYEGHLIPRFKIRTKKKVILRTVEQMEACAENGTAYSGKVYLTHSACMEDAQAVASLIEQRFPNIEKPIQINSIGTTIGSHTGPGTVALFFWGTERVD